MRKKLTLILTCVMLVCLALAVFTACDTTNNDNGDEQILAVYNTYVAQMEEDGETPLSYEQWLKTIKGEKGDKGDKGDKGEKGDAGQNGTNGTNGTNGKDGRGIVSAIINEDGDLIITYNDGTSENAGNLIVKNPTIDENNKIVFKTFTVEENIVYGKVANGTEYFSFIDEIELVGSASYIVSTDIFGLNQIPNKIVDLETGDNTFYIREECGNAIKVYKVLIRKDLHIVTFNTNNGTAIEPLTVETGEIISTPALTKNGYDLSWDFDFNTPITSDITVNAIWSAIFTISNNSITGLTEYGKSLKEIEIQPTIDGVNITSIGYSAFYNCDNLTSVTIGNSVTRIGEGAFSGCKNLKSITLPFVGKKAGVTSSDTYQYPFGYIFGTSSYTGSYSAEQYYHGSSTSSTTFTTYYIPSTLKSVTITGGNILYGAFRNCSSLTSIEIPNSVTSIGNGAFYSCDSLTSIEIPNSVTSIGYDAFYYCSSLTSIEIPNSVTSIGNYAFYYCDSLTKVNYTGTIDDWAQIEFSGEYSNPVRYTKKLYINNQLITEANITTATKINAYAFYYCDSLTSIEIPNSVTSIGDYAFSGCDSLTSIEIPNSVTSIGDSAFYYCNSLTSIKYRGTEAEWLAISKGTNWDKNTGNYTITYDYTGE